MEKYKRLDNGKTYIVIDIKEADSNLDAMSIANKHFKTAMKNLCYDIGFVWNDLLYFDCPHPMAQMVWAIRKR